MKRPDIPPAVELTRLLANTRREGECLLWQGYVDADGYGQARWNKRLYRVHRLVYILLHGETPLEIDHVWNAGCRFNSCILPEHLEAVTRQENLTRKTTSMRHYRCGKRRQTQWGRISCFEARALGLKTVLCPRCTAMLDKVL